MLMYVKILKLSDYLDILHVEAYMLTPYNLKIFFRLNKNCAF